MIVRRCVGLALLVALTGCGAPHSEQAAVIQLVHLSPDTPDLELRIDGTPVLGLATTGQSKLSYKQASREITLNSGSHIFTISNSAGTRLLQATRVLPGGNQYSLALLGYIAPTAGQPALVLNVIQSHDVPTAAKTGIRFLNAGVGNASLDAVFERTGGVTEPIASGLAFGEASSTAAGVYSLNAVAPGTGQLVVSTGGTALVTAAVTFVAGKRQRYAAIGTLASTELVTWEGP